ncbi:hypothetical protein CDL15_Pgr007138 [Punica granatum]|uniref:Uncharacterized protein n=1 Tax=Punica granatum TaxID=22663 RepID=A0A218X830_PUNGR|nr:hypothetical protein CDL15_Pgr007138 [Punica granatum]
MSEFQVQSGTNCLERGRRGEEGPAADAAGGGVADIDGVLQLVEPALEDAESEEQPDEYHHQYQARAQHAHPAPAAHLLLLLPPPPPPPGMMR